MRKFIVAIVLGIALLAVPGVAHAEFFFYVQMNADGEVPPTGEAGLGESIVIISDDMSQITVDVYFDNLTGPATASHIHVGPPDATGPVVLPFRDYPNVSSGNYSNVFTADDFQPGGGLKTFDDLLQAMFDGNTYMNIHTQAHPGGEIRGQVYYYGP
jgi:hypothetical protein